MIHLGALGEGNAILMTMVGCDPLFQHAAPMSNHRSLLPLRGVFPFPLHPVVVPLCSLLNQGGLGVLLTQ